MSRKNIILDSQILNGIQLCPQRTDFQFNQDLQPPITSEPLESGGLLHVMMESYYHDVMMCGTEITYDNKNFQDSIERAILIGETHNKDLNLPSEVTNEIIYQFKENISHHRMDGWKILEVEKAFISELYKDEELGIYLTGKIDVIAEVPNYGVVVVDHKSSRRSQEVEPLSNQFTLYSWATGIKTVIINKVGFQKTIPPEKRFSRHPLFYTNEQIDRWCKNTIWWCKFYVFCLENDSWPENRTSCDKYGGCIYTPICRSATNEGMIAQISNNYIKGKKWNVTEVLMKKGKND